MGEAFEHKGLSYAIEAVYVEARKQYACIITTGAFACVVVREPDAVKDDGPLVLFQTPQEAIAEGKLYIQQDAIRSR